MTRKKKSLIGEDSVRAVPIPHKTQLFIHSFGSSGQQIFDQLESFILHYINSDKITNTNAVIKNNNYSSFACG